MHQVRKRDAVSRIAAGLIVVVALAAVAVAFLYLSPAPSTSTTSHTTTSITTSTTSTTTTSTTQTTTTASPVVIVIIPNGVGADATLNFQPATIRVVIGVNNTVQWIQQDSVPHNVISTSVPSGTQSFRSTLTLSQGQTFTVTLTVPGTYKYYCSIHPTYMLGQIEVLSR